MKYQGAENNSYLEFCLETGSEDHERNGRTVYGEGVMHYSQRSGLEHAEN
jgi:hypothetical protein